MHFFIINKDGQKKDRWVTCKEIGDIRIGKDRKPMRKLKELREENCQGGKEKGTCFVASYRYLI